MANFFDGLPLEDPSKLHGFSGNRIDRRSENREEDAVPAALADPAARLYLMCDDQAVLKHGSALDPLFTVAEADGFGAARSEVVLLGWTGGGPRLAVTLPAEAVVEDDRIQLTDLRALAVDGGVGAEDLGALAQARSLCYWNIRHRFCGVCGAETDMKAGGYRRECPACGAPHFPRTDPVVIMLAIDMSGDEERCLLGRQSRFAEGMYSCLAGFVEPGETIEDAVRRETAEEAGIELGRVRYHSSQPWPFPCSLMIGCHGEALTTDITRDEVELEDARWFPRGEVRSILAGTHASIKCPPPIAIAHGLIRYWAEGR
ncbi:MAG: NAD(+) diphosphatase [Bauldia sp.]|uniref:NAD(+) diphosphatase n=1 Tax=Bauldia sp. TaxID=2575872 RepID=UPI001DDE7705|nr:NAD(+) diphosphatase [Bauldia sp.]MCB1494697.1 NAD(+) diphosphatase [Bauldia sp.]